MMKLIIFIKRAILISIVVLLLSTCGKEEFLPEPIGEIIPSEELPALTEILNEDASLFALAWKKAEMDHLAFQKYELVKFTFLIPSNNAMEAAGFNKTNIENSRKEDLQQIIKYHLLFGSVNSSILKAGQLDDVHQTILDNPKFYYTKLAYGARDVIEPYMYHQYLNFKNDKFYINGNQVNLVKEIDLAQGHAFIIDQVLSIPDRQMIDVLKSDARFSLYVYAIELSLPIYQNTMELSWWTPFPAPMSFYIDFLYKFPGSLYEDKIYKRGLFNFTLFAPTNEAFNKIGIFNEEDINELNSRTIMPEYFNEEQTTPVDSLLNLQNFGWGNASLLLDEFGTMGLDFSGLGNYIMFSSIFDEKLFPKYNLTNGMDYYGNPQASYPELRFKVDGEDLLVNHLSSTSKDVKIVERNINTVQGPIHAVDQIFVPEGFTMWHKK